MTAPFVITGVFMRKVDRKDYCNFISFARMNTANRIYPMSIAEGFQTGDIYVNDGDDVVCVFFWHYCGFGFISGTPSKSFLEEILKLKGGRRLFLITNDKDVICFFSDRSYDIGSRLEFGWNGEYNPIPVSEGFLIEPITASNINKIKGRIIPSFSWESSEQFLKDGFGYVAVNDIDICAVAFGAVSSEEVDIGVETYDEYRRKGLSAALASKMCERILNECKKPVWSCAEANEGSKRTAIKVGFKQVQVNKVIKVIE